MEVLGFINIPNLVNMDKMLFSWLPYSFIFWAILTFKKPHGQTYTVYFVSIANVAQLIAQWYRKTNFLS